MKSFSLVVLVFLLAGCANSGGGAAGTPELNPTRAQASAKIHTELAASYFERAQYAVALQEVGLALQADSDYAQAYNVRALVRMALKEDEQADADFRRSLQLDGESADTHNNYGWYLCQRGRMKDAIKQFQEALKNPLYATPETAYVNLAACSKKAGLMKDVESNFQRALILHPGLPEALYGLADLSYSKDDYAGAKAYFLRFQQASAQELNAEQLWLAVRIERKMRDRNSEASYTLQLRKRFPDSRETQLLSQGE